MVLSSVTNSKIIIIYANLCKGSQINNGLFILSIEGFSTVLNNK